MGKRKEGTNTTSVDKHGELNQTTKSRRRQWSTLNNLVGSSAALAVVGIEGLDPKIIPAKAGGYLVS